MVIIDEAAQLKECESCIPLQLHGFRHAVLIGDEKQLPAMVQSNMSGHAGFGRSLFERLVKLGHPRHLLKVQYRMHPSISLFPKKQFYDDKILDGSNVKELSYGKSFLRGRIFGSYSFIDVPNGKEGTNDRGSSKNMVEVFVIAEIVDRLQKVLAVKLSPYKAQVLAIQEKLGRRFSTDVASKFSVNVRSVDGFQGSEEDIIIISTVRCNRMDQFNETLLVYNRKKIVIDAKSRGCFHDASEDDRLTEATIQASIEFDQLGTLLRTDSPLFKDAKWKVCFSDEFLKSMIHIGSDEIFKQVISVMRKLSRGWRMPRPRSPPSKKMYDDGIASQLMEIYNFTTNVKLSFTTDILKENSMHIQVIKFWDVMPSAKIPVFARALDMLFEEYPTGVVARCKDKQIEGKQLGDLRTKVEASETSQKLQRDLGLPLNA
ncbi:hypothetical protein Leryth_013858 [Lithospermum erythrorhizon]|nr:hypothetical protein Leryth_013858 [Lithospermum erythrorhizon]